MSGMLLKINPPAGVSKALAAWVGKVVSSSGLVACLFQRLRGCNLRLFAGFEGGAQTPPLAYVQQLNESTPAHRGILGWRRRVAYIKLYECKQNIVEKYRENNEANSPEKCASDNKLGGAQFVIGGASRGLSDTIAARRARLNTHAARRGARCLLRDGYWVGERMV